MAEHEYTTYVCPYKTISYLTFNTVHTVHGFMTVSPYKRSNNRICAPYIAVEVSVGFTYEGNLYFGLVSVRKEILCDPVMIY